MVDFVDFGVVEKKPEDDMGHPLGAEGQVVLSGDVRLTPYQDHICNSPLKARQRHRHHLDSLPLSSVNQYSI